MAMKMDEWEYKKLKAREKYEAVLLQIRAWINTSPRLIITIAAVSAVMLIAGIIAIATGNDPKQAESQTLAWYYDLNTKELFKARQNLIPPVKAPSGPAPDGSLAGVRAYVYNITDPLGNTQQVVGYLEKLAPNADKSAYAVDPEASPGTWGKGILVRRPEDTEWIAADSTEAKKMIAAFYLPDSKGKVPQPVPAD